MRYCYLLPFLLGLSGAAIAQSGPGDVRCLLISNLFAKNASEEAAKQVAAQSLAYYLGRLESRMGGQALADAIRAEGARIDPRTAAADMRGCASGFARAMRSLQSAGQAVRPRG